MNIKILTIIFCSGLVIFVLYKLYNNDKFIEHFGVLEKMKNISKKKKKEKEKGKDKFSNTDSKKKTTFDDLIKTTENISSDHNSLENMYTKIQNYKDSFNKVKFKNNSKSTAESLEKFTLYKEQFFNIFK